MCLSDEVYEWLVYSGSKHVKIGKYQNKRSLLRLTASLAYSHSSWDVGENYHCWKCRKDIPCNWMEGKKTSEY